MWIEGDMMRLVLSCMPHISDRKMSDRQEAVCVCVCVCVCVVRRFTQRAESTALHSDILFSSFLLTCLCIFPMFE